MVDLAIVIALAAGTFAGWRKGFIVPLVVQAGALLGLAATNPTFSAFADPTMLDQITAVAAKAPIPTEQLAKYDATLGEHLPVIGQHVVFPTK